MPAEHAPHTVVMTACLRPDPQFARQLQRVDPAERTRDYADALRFWLTLPDRRIEAVIFIENTLAPLANCLDLMVPPGLMLLAVLAGFIFLISRLLRLLPPYAHLAQAYTAYFAALVRYGLDKLVKPVIAVNAFFASWQALNKRIFKH